MLLPRPLGVSSLRKLLEWKFRDEFLSSIWSPPLYQAGQDLRSRIRATPIQVWRRPLADMSIQSNSAIGVLYLIVHGHKRRCFIQCRDKSNIRELGRVKVNISNRMVVEKVSQSQLAHFGVRTSAQCNNVFQWGVATEAELGKEKFGYIEVHNH